MKIITKLAVLTIITALAFGCATITPAKVEKFATSLQAAHDRAIEGGDPIGAQCWARGLTYVPMLRTIARPSVGTFDKIEQAHLITMLRDDEKDIRHDCAEMLSDLRSFLGLTPSRRVGLPF